MVGHLRRPEFSAISRCCLQGVSPSVSAIQTPYITSLMTVTGMQQSRSCEESKCTFGMCSTMKTNHCVRARKTMILPLSKPITSTDGKLMNEIVVPKDTTIFISLLDCNLDPEIWGPDAAEWKPERWMSPLPETVTAAKIPGVYSNLSVEILPCRMRSLTLDQNDIPWWRSRMHRIQVFST